MYRSAFGSSDTFAAGVESDHDPTPVSSKWIIAWLVLGSTFAFSAGTATGREPDVAKRRARMLEVAESYVRHEWRAGPANVFHGLDSEGVRVDTPDAAAVTGGFKADGSTNVGVPYQWGGFCSLAEFDEGVRAKMYAGHDPADMSAQASYRAVGVDCSGFVSRCWNLPFKRSTRNLPAICYELSDYAELQPGDIVNHANQHVMMFAGFTSEAKTVMRVYEATIPAVHEMTISTDDLKRLDYHPLRYKPLDPRWKEEALTFAPASLILDRGHGDARWTRERAARDEHAWTEAADPLRTMKRDEWVAYAATYDHPLRQARRAYELTFGCIAARESQARLAITTAVGESTGEVVEDREFHATSLASLLALFLEIDVVEITKLSTTAESGRLAIDKRTLDVTRRTADFDGRLYTKDGTPLHVSIVCCTSERVPLHGIVDANFELRVGAGEKPLVIVHHFELTAARSR
jgi:cell wall-associated NlpC family hydrolase